MSIEKSITKIDFFLGKQIHLIAYGTSYIGRLQKVDYDKGFVMLSVEHEVVTIELEQIQSFEEVSVTN